MGLRHAAAERASKTSTRRFGCFGYEKRGAKCAAALRSSLALLCRGVAQRDALN